jgi:hypothetical protein
MVLIFIPEEFNHRVNKLCNAYLINARIKNFVTDLQRLINTKFEEVKK